MASQVRSPAFAWSQRVRHVNYGECYYFQPISVADVDALDAPLACEHFNQVLPPGWTPPLSLKYPPAPTMVIGQVGVGDYAVNGLDL